MPRKIKQTNNKPEKAGSVSAPKIRIIPESLKAIRFDDSDLWLKAYRENDPVLVARAVMIAFRRRYLLSQKSAAERIGISANTWNKWENGTSAIRWDSKNALVRARWFKPQHFGLDASAEEFLQEEI